MEKVKGGVGRNPRRPLACSIEPMQLASGWSVCWRASRCRLTHSRSLTWRRSALGSRPCPAICRRGLTVRPLIHSLVDLGRDAMERIKDGVGQDRRAATKWTPCRLRRWAMRHGQVFA